MRVWVYHETEQPKIVNSDEAESYYNEGWKDTPAAFLKLEDVGIDKELTDKGDPDETAKAQQVLDAVEGVADSLNGALNIDEMNKYQLDEYADKHYGVTLNKRKSLKNLRKQVKELVI